MNHALCNLGFSHNPNSVIEGPELKNFLTNFVPRNKTTIFIKGKLRTYEMKKIDVDKTVSGSSYSNLRNVWRMKTRTISVVTVILKEIRE